MVLFLLAIFVAGCATTAALRSGERAELAQDYDRAVVEYTRALQGNPDYRGARHHREIGCPGSDGARRSYQPRRVTSSIVPTILPERRDGAPCYQRTTNN